MKLLVAVIVFVCLTEFVLCQSGNTLGLLAAGGLIGAFAARNGFLGGNRRPFYPPPFPGGFGYNRFSPYGPGGYGPGFGGFHRPFYG